MGSLTPIFEGLLLMDYARWKVYFKWIMPPEIAGLAPRTNLIFSPATAGAVTDGCEGIIQPMSSLLHMSNFFLPDLNQTNG